jgi:hypothetical protein
MMSRTVLYVFSIIFLILPVFMITADNGANPPRLGYAQLWPVHAVLMSLSLGLMLAGMTVSAFMKKKRWWLKTHRRLQWTGGICGIVGLATAVYMISVSTGVHFQLLHSVLGLVGIVLIVSGLTLGLLIFKVETKLKKGFRIIHRWTGRITLALMASVIVMGLMIVGIL